MRYLVTWNFIDPGPLLPPQQAVGMIHNAVLPTLDTLAQLEAEGKILGGGVHVGARVVTFVIEAESHKALDALLENLPLWGLVNVAVTPLQRFEDRREQDRQTAERLAATLQ
jgi:muconolactone delta-isomerase